MRPNPSLPPALLACLISLLLATPAAAQDAGVRHATALAPDGVEIAYTVQGEGEPALVFIHCWACDQEFWREQVEVFAQDYQVVTLDLPGHGESGRDRKHWSVGGYSMDVQAVVDTLALGDLVLIGHSMGGPVALASYPLLADRARGVIAVESLHDVEAEMPAEALEGWAKTLEADYDGTMQMMVNGMFGDEGSPELRDWVLAQALTADPAAMIALIRDYVNVDLEAWISAVPVPVRAINAAPRPPVIPETRTESNQKYADFDAVLLEGVGHYILLEDPDDFNELLRLELADLLMSED
jgi:pimeloyl-ACP methyl ester carboxylesterase